MSPELWITILSSLGTFVATIAGCGILFYRQNKRIKAAEASNAEQATQHAYVMEWKALYEKKEERVDVLEAKLDKVRSDLREERMSNNSLRLENEKLKWAKCTVNGCKNRKPPHYYDMDGNEVLAPCENCKQQ